MVTKRKLTAGAGLRGAHLVDLSGNKYNRLHVVDIACRKRKTNARGNINYTIVFWNCICDCGNRCVVNGTSIRTGKTKSCGCLRVENAKNVVGKLHTHGKTGTYEHAMWLGARYRAKKQGIPFDLKLESIVIPGTCPVLNIPIDRLRRGPKDNWPSLDKIYPAKGYVQGNVAVISMRANRIKSDASLEELEAIVNYIKRGEKFEYVNNKEG